MKRHNSISIIVTLLVVAAPVAVCAQTQALDGAAIVVVHVGSLPYQTMPKPSAQFAVNSLNAIGSDGRGQPLFMHAAERISIEMLVRVVQSIMPDSHLDVIVEVPMTDSIVAVADGSRHEHQGPPLFFALLSIPHVNQSVPMAVSPRGERDDKVIGPEFVPMAAPQFRSGGPAPTRGPRK